MYVIPEAQLLAQLVDLVGVGDPLDAAELHLFTNDFNPNPLSVVADFVEATGTGYTAPTLTWLTPGINAQGFAEVVSDIAAFVWTNGETDTQTIFGYFMTNAAGTTVLLSERFDDPVLINRDGQQLNVIARYVLGQS